MTAQEAEANADTPQVRSVFVLHSYSQEYPWTHGQHHGFLRALKADSKNIYDLKVEYLDTKRAGYTPAYADFIARHLEKKYRNYQPTAVYVSDDNALSFALSHLTQIFPKAPIFFSGVNNYEIKSKLDPRRVTGVFEKKEIGPNLDLLSSISPDARQNIVIIGDASETYRAIKREIQTALLKHPDIHPTFISSARLGDLVKRLRATTPRFIFLTTLGAVVDDNGRTLTLGETINAIVESGEFTVFSMEDAYLFPGVLGGYVTSGPLQGQSAGKLLIRHLNGESLSTLPPIETSPNEYVFNDIELTRTGLVLPESVGEIARRTNIRPTFYESNRPLILGSLYVLGGLVVIFLFFAVYVYTASNRQLALYEAKRRDDIQRLNDSLAKIVKSQALSEANVATFVTQVTELVSSAIGVDRVSIWTLNAAGRGIECVDLWDQNENAHSSGGTLNDVDCPSYFQALMTERTLVFDDVYTDEQTRELAEEYLPSHGITSMLDAPFFIKGKIGGVLCMEHVGPNRRWTLEEESFAISMTDIISLAYEIEVRQRTENLLVQAKNEAEKANTTKSDFLASMSHDLRTPLNAILGFAEIISQQHFGPITEKYQEYAEDIHSSGELLLSLVNDILDLSTIEAGKLALDKENLSIAEIFTECEKIIKERALSLGIDLVVEVPEDLSPLYADRRATKQILLNLLTNSVKFTPEGGKVTLKAAATNKHHTIEVSDTGTGISADMLATITDPFVRVETDPHKTQEGTGLGLTIVKSLVDLHGGELNIKSTVGRGTTVTVTFPKGKS